MNASDSLWMSLRPGMELTIVKSHYQQDRSDYRYPARVIETDRPGWFAFEAIWKLPDMDVDGILYETGGTLIEYFSPEQYFNIFHVFRRSGGPSGLYANITELPVLIEGGPHALVLTWIDCWLDVIKLPGGETKLLDEDELVASGVEQTNAALAQRIRRTASEALQLLSSDEWNI